MYSLAGKTLFNIEDIDNVEFLGLEFDQYPYYRGALITGATYEGYDMDREQLDALNNDRYLVMVICLNFIHSLNNDNI